LLATTAGIHVAIAPAHLAEAPYAGALFIALSTAALLISALLLARGNRLAWLAAAVLSTGALLAYLASRSIGLPSLADDIGDWLNPLGVAAVIAETTAVLVCGLTLLQTRSPSPRSVPVSGSL